MEPMNSAATGTARLNGEKLLANSSATTIATSSAETVASVIAI